MVWATTRCVLTRRPRRLYDVFPGASASHCHREMPPRAGVVEGRAVMDEWTVIASQGNITPSRLLLPE